MLGATDIVDSAVLESDQRDALSRARYASMHLLSLVNTMIDLSRIESGVLQLHVQAMNLRDELDALQAMMRPDASQRGVELTLERTTLSPTPVMGDATRLQEVLLHLVKFTIDHARASEVHLLVWQSQDGGTVHFCVSSLGPASNTHAADASATVVADPAQDNFSLDLCEKLIALMGGTLLAPNEAKEPIRFEFALRMPQTPTTVAVPATEKAKTAKRRKMLIVDDSIDNRMLLQVYLKEQPWDLRFAEDGLIAVNEAQQECFDLILMDIRMPRMNGHDATRKIREIELEQPARMRAKILAITADDSVNDRQRSIEAGCDDHLVKPLSKTKLMQVLASI
jgi:CheY-like chemotaxis protein